MERHAKTWDSVPFPKITIDDLDTKAFEIFKNKASIGKRIDEGIVNDSHQSLLENLKLLDGDYITRAGILLFHPKPETFFTGASVKIGYFESDDDLRYQDEITGSLFEQVEKTLDLIRTKYLKAEIRYEGVTRVEELPFPYAALREALLNAIAHKDYTSTTPIQISVYADKMIFWNEGELPKNWTINNLLEKHPSKPFNPKISNAFFRSGYIEAWGRGTIKMMHECRKRNLPNPNYRYEFSGFIVEFKSNVIIGEGANEGVNEGANEGVNILIEIISRNPGLKAPSIARLINKSLSTTERYLKQLRNRNIIEFRGASKSGGYYLIKEKQIE